MRYREYLVPPNTDPGSQPNWLIHLSRLAVTGDLSFMEPASLVAPAQPHRPFVLETKQPQDVPESGKRKASE
ncbi:hypothetical protein PG997_015391 [Apiospora hydei]|uniref:Uncharacterized protein n=1 Tax=Apiospora hydei TaxID=1337664 RepID=A0ABR1UQH8_9PEZI